MSPTRLRAIATRLESVCVEKRVIKREGNVACEGCQAAARELREFARELEPKRPVPVREMEQAEVV